MSSLASLEGIEVESADRTRIGRVALEVGAVLGRRPADELEPVLAALGGVVADVDAEGPAGWALSAIYAVVDAFVAARSNAERRDQQMLIARQPTHLRVLKALQGRPALPSDLADLLTLGRSTVTEALDKLRKADLVEVWRPPGRHDRRTEPQRLTAAGIACLAEIRRTDRSRRPVRVIGLQRRYVRPAARAAAPPALVEAVDPTREALLRGMRNLPEIQAERDRSLAHVINAAVAGGLRLLDLPRWSPRERHLADGFSTLLDCSSPGARDRLERTVEAGGLGPSLGGSLSLLGHLAFPDWAPPLPGADVLDAPDLGPADAVMPAFLAGCSLLGIESSLLARMEKEPAEDDMLEAVRGYWACFRATANGDRTGTRWAALADELLRSAPTESTAAGRLVRRLRLSARINAAIVPFGDALHDETLALLQRTPYDPGAAAVIAACTEPFGLAQAECVVEHAPWLLRRQLALLRPGHSARLEGAFAELRDAVGSVEASLDSSLDPADFVRGVGILDHAVELAANPRRRAARVAPPLPERSVLAQRVLAEVERNRTRPGALPMTGLSLHPVRQHLALAG